MLRAAPLFSRAQLKCVLHPQVDIFPCSWRQFSPGTKKPPTTVSSQLCKTSSNKLFQLVLQGTKHRHILQNRWLECFKLHLPAISLLSSHNQRQPGHSCHSSARALRIKATPGKPAGALTAHFQTAATEKSQECLSSGNGGSTSLPTTLCTDLQCDSKQNALSF